MKLSFIKKAETITGLLLSFCFYSLSALPQTAGFIFVCFIPFFCVLDTASSKLQAFKIAYFYGCLFFAISLFWISDQSVLTFFIAVFLFALFFGFYAIGYIWIRGDKQKYLSFIFVVASWVCLEMIRGIGFFGLPVSLAGYPLIHILPFAQGASVVGIYGLSALVISINYSLFLLINSCESRNSKIIWSCVLLTFVLFWYFWGAFKLRDYHAKETVNVAIVQGNISEERKWDLNNIDHISNTYKKLGRTIRLDQADLLIWPETALPVFILHPLREDILKGLTDFAAKNSVSVLTGAQHLQEYPEGKAVFNIALMISGEGYFQDLYGKMRLFPLREQAPHPKLIPLMLKWGSRSIYYPGDRQTLFELPTSRFSTLICFESFFPHLVKSAVMNGAQFLVNITNDEPALGSYSFYYAVTADMARMRAIENGRSLVRVSNIGYSYHVDPVGRIIRQTDLFKADAYSERIPIEKEMTFYTNFGHMFDYLAFLFCFLFISLRLIRDPLLRLLNPAKLT